MSKVVPRGLLILLLTVLASGCVGDVLQPSGDVALQQRNLVIASTVLMLLIIVPVMALTALFAWKYRASNKDAEYDPEFHHSTQLELVIWSAPLLIIIALGAMTWISTHTLDPYRRLGRLAAGQPLDQSVKPLRVQAVALDWKWLFIYPDYGVATVNEMAAPVNTPIAFQITASSVMNAFYVPALAGMVYAMPAMQTQLHAVINQPGNYQGFSANYSGAGFSDMHFRFLGMSQADFDNWIATLKNADAKLGRQDYLALERPSVGEPVRKYGSVAPNLYDAIVNLCVDPGKMCQRDMMKIDAQGGLGLAGVGNVARLSHDRPRAEFRGYEPNFGRDYVLALCAVDPEALWSPASAARAAPAN
ncbi:MAG: ubiquinol oxidase subunit II [Nevskia sp.]|nr:ubiquinol oxidase subunit II [Nevskia sp.]